MSRRGRRTARKIAFQSYLFVAGFYDDEVYVMNADGTNRTRINNNPAKTYSLAGDRSAAESSPLSKRLGRHTHGHRHPIRSKARSEVRIVSPSSSAAR